MNEKDWKLNFKNKLTQRLSETKTTQRELANKIKLTEGIVSGYCSGKRFPTIETILKIEKALSVPEGWFIYFKDDISVVANKTIKKIKRLKSSFKEIPLITMNSIDNFLSNGILPETGTYRTVLMEKNNLTNPFLTIIEGDSMMASSDNPLSLSPGDEILADPNVEPKIGCLVIIKLNNDDIKIRQYQKDGSDIIFKAFDPKYPNIIKDEKVKILAVILEKKIPLY